MSDDATIPIAEAIAGTCWGCGVALATNRAPGRARKWCSNRCRKQAERERRARIVWSSVGPLEAPAIDPETYRRRTIAALAAIVAGEPPAAVEDQVAQLLIEARVLAFMLRRRADDLPPKLAARTLDLATAISEAVSRTFPGVV